MLVARSKFHQTWSHCAIPEGPPVPFMCLHFKATPVMVRTRVVLHGGDYNFELKNNYRPANVSCWSVKGGQLWYLCMRLNLDAWTACGKATLNVFNSGSDQEIQPFLSNRHRYPLLRDTQQRG
eukprot:TRINITY_DN13200_c0_g2_i1.p2 TRINITY_DN13200_c0_g2~~TRINITY_DN13200_c0_g2_i1.p2  ORF type:complete len:123 (+),score=3.26 TRINITY_DN13200_c0_g2_i1:18-386(+)